MKSYEYTAFTIYEGIISDAITRWSNLEPRLRKDMSYLRRAVEQRGLPFLTITLPSCAKSLMKWLDTGSMCIEDIPQGYPLYKKRPKLFGDLFDLVFDDQGSLRLNPDIDAVQFLMQLLSCCKNVRLDCPSSKVKETLDEFFAIEEVLPRSHPDTWDCDRPVWRERIGHPLWGARVLDRDDEQTVLFSGPNSLPDSLDLPWDDFRAFAREIIGRWIGDYPVWDLKPRHGPGAVSE